MSQLSFPNAHTQSLLNQSAVFMKRHISLFLQYAKKPKMLPLSLESSQPN